MLSLTTHCVSGAVCHTVGAGEHGTIFRVSRGDESDFGARLRVASSRCGGGLEMLGVGRSGVRRVLSRDGRVRYTVAIMCLVRSCLEIGFLPVSRLFEFLAM